uniref:Uncharacterized protein n=1 Tax=Anguilla anguilla TaxID=7936 RepID=A0A0E9TSA2_ANGAN
MGGHRPIGALVQDPSIASRLIPVVH